jgi:hypothetical protein
MILALSASASCFLVSILVSPFGPQPPVLPSEHGAVTGDVEKAGEIIPSATVALRRAAKAWQAGLRTVFAQRTLAGHAGKRWFS